MLLLPRIHIFCLLVYTTIMCSWLWHIHVYCSMMRNYVLYIQFRRIHIVVLLLRCEHFVCSIAAYTRICNHCDVDTSRVLWLHNNRTNVLLRRRHALFIMVVYKCICYNCGVYMFILVVWRIYFVFGIVMYTCSCTTLVYALCM